MKDYKPGDKIHGWELIENIRFKQGHKYYYGWLCKCKCGKIKQVRNSSLLYNGTKDCGCSRTQALYNRNWSGYKGLSGRYWSSVIKHATKRNIKVNIDIKEAWEQFVKQNGRCALTGLPITLISEVKKRSQQTASLDRIDSKLGYEVNNIQWTHKEVNIMKNQLNESKFIEYCKLVAKHRG